MLVLCKRPRAWHKKVAAFLTDTNAKRDTLRVKTTNDLYRYLITQDAKLERPKIALNSDNGLPKHLISALRHRTITPRAREHLFLYSHNILATNDRLEKCLRSRGAPPPRECLACDEEDNRDHLLVCRATKEAVELLRTKIIETLSPITQITNEQINSTFFPHPDKERTRLATWLAAETRQEIWDARDSRWPKKVAWGKTLVKLEVIKKHPAFQSQTCQDMLRKWALQPATEEEAGAAAEARSDSEEEPRP